MYDIIDNIRDWKILFEALVKSLLIQNFIPMLAIDPRAGIWADKNFLYTIMYTFGFPRFTSHSLLQAMLQIEATGETVQKQLIAGSTNLNTSSQQRESYITLEEILLHGDLLTHIEKQAIQLKNHGRPTVRLNHHTNNNMPRSDRLVRQHFNPELQIDFQQGIPTKPGTLAWLFHHHQKSYQGSTDRLTRAKETKREARDNDTALPHPY